METKKTYETPEIEVIILNETPQLLASSPKHANGTPDDYFDLD